ncbi:hypothetical protein HII36_29630 [Nonomuraea sp. NN258]|uniref:hypothetical protein n=1 Tax=Nonomuraea antri TaxID=2730852 RepID=UPI00156970DB|nr:hypothetical protein [Nonomuraea antri]NRQ35962.1 hypothetical protein [Nonomuraea antri]
MKRPVRTVIAIVTGLIMAGAVTSAILGVLAWGFTLLLCAAGLLVVIRLLDPAGRGERSE